MAPNQESDDVFKLKRFRKMFADYTKEFKVGVHKATSSAATSPAATTPGKRPPSSTATASEPSSDVGSGEKAGSKEGSNEKVADAKEIAKQDDEEFENEGGTTTGTTGTTTVTMAHSKIKNRHLQWKGAEGEEKKKERKKVSDKRSKDRETSPYLRTTKDKRDTSPYEARSIDLDEGIRKRKRSSAKKKKNGDKSGKSGKSMKSSGKTEREKRQSRTNVSTTRKASRNKTEDGADAKSPGRKTSPGRRTSPHNSSPVKTDVADSPVLDNGAGRDPTVDQSREPIELNTVTCMAPIDDKKIDCAEIDPNSNDFKTAIKLMEILKRNNILENALFPAQNETLRSFFEGGMKNPERKILELISKAMDFVLDAVFFKGEDMDCIIDNELKTFIVDRFKSKPILLDVIISRPEFLPQSWGGRTVVLRQTEATVLVQPDKKDKK